MNVVLQEAIVQGLKRLAVILPQEVSLIGGSKPLEKSNSATDCRLHLFLRFDDLHLHNVEWEANAQILCMKLHIKILLILAH